MSLNIKNPETCRLADELASLTGETNTGAITLALRECLEREKRGRSVEDRVRELHAVGRRCARLLSEGTAAVARSDLLYDEHGLPG